MSHRHLIVTMMLAIGLSTMVRTTGVHFALVKASPAAGQTLDAAPARLQIWFSQAPAALVSQLSLTSGKTTIALGKTVVDAKDKSMYADPVKPLDPGAYLLAWKSAGDDGHVLTGEVKFTIVKR